MRGLQLVRTGVPGASVHQLAQFGARRSRFAHWQSGGKHGDELDSAPEQPAAGGSVAFIAIEMIAARAGFYWAGGTFDAKKWLKMA